MTFNPVTPSPPDRPAASDAMPHRTGRLRPGPGSAKLVKIGVFCLSVERCLQQSNCGFIKADSFAATSVPDRLLDFRRQIAEGNSHEISVVLPPRQSGLEPGKASFYRENMPVPSMLQQLARSHLRDHLTKQPNRVIR